MNRDLCAFVTPQEELGLIISGSDFSRVIPEVLFDDPKIQKRYESSMDLIIRVRTESGKFTLIMG